jgi:hypothetical protein
MTLYTLDTLTALDADLWMVKDPPEGYVGKHRRPERTTVIFPLTEVESTAWLPNVGKLPIPGWWVKPLISVLVFLLALVVTLMVVAGVRVQPDLPGAPPTVQHGPTLPNGGR